MDIIGGGSGLAPPPPLPALGHKKVTIFGHKKMDLKPATLGSPQPVHVHGRGEEEEELPAQALCPQTTR